MRNKFKLLCCLLALIMLVSGCATAPSDETEQATGSSDLEMVVMPDIPEVTLDPVNLLADGIYCTGGNYDLEIYPFSSTQFLFVDLFTKEPLPDDAVVTLDTSVPYSIGIGKVEYTDTVENLYPYYLYECTQGTDWAKMAEAYLKVQYGYYEEGQLRKKGITPTQQQKDRWAKDNEAYDLLFDACKESYLEQLEVWETAEELPVYHYRIVFNFTLSKAVNNVITEATLTYGGKSLTIPIGEVRLEADAELPYPVGNGVDSETIAISGHPAETPWSDEYLELLADIDFKAEANITIKDLYFYNDAAKISDCSLNLTSMGMSVNQTWSPGEETLELLEGDEVIFDITIADQKLTQREYQNNLVLILEYEQNGETYCSYLSVQILRRHEPYEVSLWAFEGVDTQSYYQQFLNVANSVSFEGE